jgi:alpha-1,3/alpha-1,6-mannosyltransferase
LRCVLESTANIFIFIKLLKSKSKILLYFHFPDLLLVQHNTLIRKIYQLSFDFFEKKSLESANKVLMNSKFTQSSATEMFGASNVDILYSCVNERNVERKISSTSVFVFINRFKRKKIISLVLKSFLVFW